MFVLLFAEVLLFKNLPLKTVKSKLTLSLHQVEVD